MRTLTGLILFAALTSGAPVVHEYRADARDHRREAREQREQREEWQEHRERNRKLFARGNWRAPFKYQKFGQGSHLRPEYYHPRYAINAGSYRLKPAGRHQRWVRHYDDVILVDARNGRVIDVKRGFFR
jgi:Ni/Co efflux regulator RcnB